MNEGKDMVIAPCVVEPRDLLHILMGKHGEFYFSINFNESPHNGILVGREDAIKIRDFLNEKLSQN